MNAQQEAVALFRYFESRGVSISGRAIGRILREELGLKFRDGDLRQWLSEFSAAAKVRPECVPHEEKLRPDCGPAAASREKEVSLVKPASSVEPLTGSKNARAPKQGTLIAVPAARHARSWVAALIDRGDAVYTKRLEEMTVDEIFTLAQLFAYHFANCKTDERANRSKANGIARALREMALRDDLGGLSGRGMLGYGKRVWERGGHRPWFKPWDILGVVEWTETG